MNETLLARLSRLPRFVVSIAPSIPSETLSIEKCRDIVATAQVRARGWYFPHIEQPFSVGPNEKYLSNDFDGSLYAEHLEQWRFYRTGEFLFRMKLWEANDTAVQQNMRRNVPSYLSKRMTDVAGFVGFITLIYSVTEAYVFAARLAQSIPYNGDIDIDIRLAGCKGWALGSSTGGIHLNGIYLAAGIPQVRKVQPIAQLVANPLELATDAIRSIFAQFSWIDASPRMIENWQRQIFG